jgi:prepilin peptidase CpaA
MLDIATRFIRNEVCLMLALLGITLQFAGQMHVAESLLAATILFLVLLVIYQRGWIGGGDVKLLVALAIGLPMIGVVQLLTITAVAGGILSLVHLMMRRLPNPKRPPGGSSL